MAKFIKFNKEQEIYDFMDKLKSYVSYAIDEAAEDSGDSFYGINCSQAGVELEESLKKLFTEEIE